MLELKNISHKYRGSDHEAVKSINLQFEEGKIYAIVGESGSGKTTLSKIMAGIMAPSQGQVLYKNEPIYPIDFEQRRQYLKEVQLVLQDSKSSLDPRMRIYKSIAEPLVNFERLSGDKLKDRVFSLLEKVELSQDMGQRYPGELSGGQQKRVCIARAIAADPQLIIFDEAVSGLDLIVQKNILLLLLDLQKESQGSYIFITHDMGTALFVSDEIIVMKDGMILEQVASREGRPEFQEEYSKLLMDSAFSQGVL